MSFIKLMQVVKSDLAKAKDPTHRRKILQGMETAYLTQVNLLIEQLNHCQDPERSEILKQIKETDKQYLEAKGIEITGHALFSRHGRCDSWGQKKFGLSPNTAISEEAAKNMSGTNQSSGSLLFYSPVEKPPYIAISPMNRAMQTAGFAIPKEIQNAQISIEPALAENSSAPSGFDVRSKKDMQKLYDETSFWKSPLKKILLKLSMWFYSDNDFEQLYLKRKEAAEKIEAHGNKILTSGSKEHPDVRQDLEYAGDKIADTKALMQQAEQCDCWFFGHGKNFQAFFKDVFGIKSTFVYGETRSVYKIKSNDEVPSLFTPPYVMIINQETGKIEGRYTGTLGAPVVEKEASIKEKVPHSEEETIPAVSQAMRKLGASVSQEIQKTGLGTQDELDVENSTLLSTLQTMDPGSDKEPLIKKST